VTSHTAAARQLSWSLWETVVSAVALVLAFAVPVRLVLLTPQRPLPGTWDTVVTVIFTVDLALRLRAHGLPRASPSKVWWWWLVVDLVAAVPWGRVLGVPGADLLRIAKVLRVAVSVRAWQHSMVIHPTVVRLGSFVVWAGLLAHWLACGWLLLDGPSSDLGTDSPYLGALYWCVTTLTTVGYGDVTPTTAQQTIYTMVVMLLGVGVYGYVIGNVASLLSKMDMARAQHVATMERLTGFMRYRRVPAPLQREIHAYYRYVWEHRMGYDESAVLDDLPPSLRTELSLVLKRDLIEKVDFLQGASPHLIRDLCLELKPVVFTPGDVVIQAGEPGRHIFFISRGEVEVIAPDGFTVLRTLSEGEFFGELALLREEPRTATVKAVTYCDLYLLGKEEFTETLRRYPEFAESIRRVSESWAHPPEDGGDGASPPVET
jgi:voltage-gated potassium channel